MRPLIGRYLATTVCALVTLSIPILLTARPMRAAETPTVEALLKKAEFDYAKTAQGAFKVIVEYKDDTSVLYVDEISHSMDEKKTELKMVRVTTLILDVPDDFKHPPAMLKKVAVLNDNLLVGRLGITEEGGDVYYQSTFWLKTADEQVTANELIFAHFNRIDFKKELKPFVTE